MRLFLTWLFLLSLSATGATYYVATSGNNTNVGSLAAPWLTVQKFWDTANAGDTGIVLEGTYAADSATVRDGSSGSPISLIGSNSPSIYGVDIEHDYVTVEGFLVRGTGRAHAIIIENANNARIIGNTFSNYPGRALQLHYTVPTPTNCWVEGNLFMGATDVCMGVMGSGHVITNNTWIQDPDGPSVGTGDAIITLARDTIFTGNTFTNWSRPVGDTSHIDIIQTFTTGNSGVHISTNVIFEKNRIISCNDVQIGMVEDQEYATYPGCLVNWVFRNNLYYECDGGLNVYAPGFQFYNNTLVRSGNSSGSPYLFRRGVGKGEGTNAVVFNNIFYQCGSNPTNEVGGFYGFDPATNSLTSLADHNLVVGIGVGTTKTGFVTEGREANGINGSDPLFVNEGALDFRLQAGSPARGAGTNLTALGFSTDINGNPRGSSWDMGAFQSFVTRSVINAVRVVIGALTE